MHQAHDPRQPPAALDVGRLAARPAPLVNDAPTGLHRLNIDPLRDALLYVPNTYRATNPAPLVVVLHGAGGTAQHGLALLQPLADHQGILLLAPSSQRQTWDLIYGRYGADVSRLDQALTGLFRQYAVDPARIAIGGFSDGASFALSVGITNGDLFTHVLAFSPGFIAPADQHGLPRLFVAHGTHDDVLPIDRCSRRIVQQLQQGGYEVSYHEFAGPHTVPTAVADEAITWFLNTPRS